MISEKNQYTQIRLLSYSLLPIPYSLRTQLDSGIKPYSYSFNHYSKSKNPPKQYMPRKDQGWITFQASQEERELLEELCRKSQRTKTEILRELVRGLNNYSPHLKQSKSIRKQPNKYTRNTLVKDIEVSSRNIIKGVITQVLRTDLNTEVI